MKAERQYKEATSRVIQSSKGSGGYIVDNRFNAVSHIQLHKLPVAQLQKQVTEKEIKSILENLENEDLKAELFEIAKFVIKSQSLFFDDMSCCYYDNISDKIIVQIPTRRLWDSEDSKIEKDAITIHELTHAAEIFSNKRNGLIPGKELDSKMIAVDKICDLLFNTLENEKENYSEVKFNFQQLKKTNLYLFCLERINYCYRLSIHRSNPSNREFPTVINQMIHVVDKKAPHLKQDIFYKYLKIFQIQATAWRKP